jgi:hypothetical protein
MALTGREPHPLLPLLPPEVEATLAPEHVQAFYDLRRESLEMERLDPYRNGYEPPVWKVADDFIASLRQIDSTGAVQAGVIQALVLGGNRASKTHWAAKKVMKTLVEKEGARVWCLQSTQAASRADQQGLVFAQIPAEWRPMSGKSRRGITEKINYTQAGGFTEDTFVLPNGSQCWFKFYGANVGSLEGAELDLAWADELVPPDWIEALRFRLITRNGLLVVTFTPVEGYSSTVKEFLDGAVTVEEVAAELLPIRRPKAESRNGKAEMEMAA